MRSLAEVRQHRVVLVGGGHPREGELRRLLEHADFEVTFFHRRGSTHELTLSDAMLDADLNPPPDALILSAGSVITTLRALEQHPVLRWVDPIVAPWSAMDEGVGTPLRIEQLLAHLQASHLDRVRVSRELANTRRAVFQLAPLGPLPLLLAAARTKGTTLVFESGVARARISLAHGRFVGGRATDAAQLRTVRGIEALAVALRIPEAEVLVVHDEEDEPIGDVIDDALHAAMGMEPTIEMSGSSFLRPAPRVVEPRKETSDALRLPVKREPTLRFGKVIEDEPRTKLWHRPLAREWPESPPEKKHASTQRYGFPSGAEQPLEDDDESDAFGLPERAVREITAPQRPSTPTDKPEITEKAEASLVTPFAASSAISLSSSPRATTPAAFAETVRVGFDAVRALSLGHDLRGPQESSVEASTSLPPPPIPQRSHWKLVAAACSALGLVAAIWLGSPSAHVEVQREHTTQAASPAARTTVHVVASTPSAALFATPTPSLEALLAPSETTVVALEAAPETTTRARPRRHRARARHAQVLTATAEASSSAATPATTAEAPAPSTAPAPAATPTIAAPAPLPVPPVQSVPAPTPARDPSILTPPDSV